MSSRPAWSTRASSREGSKATEKPCLEKQKKIKNKNKKWSTGLNRELSTEGSKMVERHLNVGSRGGGSCKDENTTKANKPEANFIPETRSKENQKQT